MGSSSWMLIIYVVAFIAIFYFMAIRPQQRQRRAHAALLASLKKGDSVVTASGIYGKVKRVEENFVVIEVAKGVNMKIARRAVAEIIRDNAQARAVAPEATGGARGKRGRAEIEEQVYEEIEDATPEEIEGQVAEDFDEEATDVADAEEDSEKSDS
ncbi:MAG: preprotein translocase subunit YajC [Actinobacteria bacterium]|nr:preprotein translocase subunit YajC [Actinomycetota bacterium]